MTRHPDWEQRLKAAVQKHIEMEPAWGRSDCFMFACDAYKAVIGETLLPDLRRYRSEAGGYRLFRRHGFKTVEDALGSVLDPCAVLTARRGDLGVVERDGVMACCVVTAMGAMVRVDHGRGFEYWPQDAMKTAFRVG